MGRLNDTIEHRIQDVTHHSRVGVGIGEVQLSRCSIVVIFIIIRVIFTVEETILLIRIFAPIFDLLLSEPQQGTTDGIVLRKP